MNRSKLFRQLVRTTASIDRNPIVFSRVSNVKDIEFADWESRHAIPATYYELISVELNRRSRNLFISTRAHVEGIESNVQVALPADIENNFSWKSSKLGTDQPELQVIY